MGSYAELYIAGFPVHSTKSAVDPVVMTIFREADKSIRGRAISDRNQLVWPSNTVLEKRVLITSHHWFDVVDRILVGRGSYIAGVGSQFWTHGYSSEDREIVVGTDSYIGSVSIFTPGSKVPDRSIVGAGSIVTAKFYSVFCLISGNPASVVRENYWRTRTLVLKMINPNT